MPKGTVVRREVYGCRLLSVNMDKRIQIKVKKICHSSHGPRARGFSGENSYKLCTQYGITCLKSGRIFPYFCIPQKGNCKEMGRKGQDSGQPPRFLVEATDLSSCIFLVGSSWEEYRIRTSIINQRMLPLEEGEPLLMDSVCISGLSEDMRRSRKGHPDIFLRIAELDIHHAPAIAACDPMLFLLLPSAVSQLRRIFHAHSKRNALWEMADIYRAAHASRNRLYEAMYIKKNDVQIITGFAEIGS